MSATLVRQIPLCCLKPPWAEFVLARGDSVADFTLFASPVPQLAGKLLHVLMAVVHTGVHSGISLIYLAYRKARRLTACSLLSVVTISVVTMTGQAQPLAKINSSKSQGFFVVSGNRKGNCYRYHCRNRENS